MTNPGSGAAYMAVRTGVLQVGNEQRGRVYAHTTD